MNNHTIEECMKASFAGTPFPKVVERLAGAGVKSYNADLVKLRKTYYGANGEAYDEALPLNDAPPIAPAFDQQAVVTSLKAIQTGKIGYAEFLRQIMTAGCLHYEVFIAGRKAMYFGRSGEFYIEHFPQAK